MSSDLNREYSPSSVLSSLNTTLEKEIARYTALSDDAYETYRFVNLSYGERSSNHVLLTTPGRTTQRQIPTKHQTPSQALIYVHGGYWQELSARQSLFNAGDAIPLGLGFASVGYTLAPNISLREICAEVIAAVKAIRNYLPDTELILAGSSAGAHLCAWILHHEPALISQVILLSGIYDLQPLVNTYVNEKLGLDLHEATILSPQLIAPPCFDRSRIAVAVGEYDTLTFREQSHAYAEHLEVECIEIAHRHHFDLPFELGRWLTKERKSS